MSVAALLRNVYVLELFIEVWDSGNKAVVFQ